ncbi:sulfurtransferase [Lutispora sp.]|uniref:sulfurtransferase n=1 Tax=Lutispora sp. TaxID=2828727 RepID=UPI002B209C83|nr:sulfurtransferase [Lutispora sp.]MEA4962324.1 sulfurtransferase [Lutispora sp.]
MKTIARILLVIMLMSALMLLPGCSSQGKSSGDFIIGAKDALALIGKDKVVFVDMQKPEDYAKGHIKGAVNIVKDDIVINVPVDNMLAPKAKIEEVFGKNGISNDTTIIVYDNNKNMEAARFWWTAMVYGHENIKVVSGGINALKSAKAEVTTEVPAVAASVFKAKDKNTDMIAAINEVKDLANDPNKGIVLLDTRTKEEFDQGTIPGSVLLDFSENNYKDGTYKSIQDIKIQYMEKGIKPDKTVIMYCKTSIRAAQTYLALYNAGYRNLKLYDGAWLEWSANPNNPIQMPEGSKVEASQKDNS